MPNIKKEYENTKFREEKKIFLAKLQKGTFLFLLTH